jgi:predicted 3-demethylubiquinone-9 3-methyltransferase (glyoxalase superfamily)
MGSSRKKNQKRESPRYFIDLNHRGTENSKILQEQACAIAEKTREAVQGSGKLKFELLTEIPTSLHEEHASMRPKNMICLWFDHNALEAARFYAATFPDSKVTAVHKAPGDFPDGKEGDELMVEFTVLGIPCLGLNGGPTFKHSEAFSFQVATDDQEETDRYWNAIVGNGGEESACGWCKDRWGLSWQITPRALTDALAAGGAEAKRAFDAMMKMGKIDIATIEAARRG